MLYIDEVNLLADHLVDLLLDAAAAGTHVVEREGVAVRHPARFVLVGSMNPAEGELRPQLADRFGLRVDMHTPTDPAGRAGVIRRRLAFDADPAGFRATWAADEAKLGREIAAARAALAGVQLTDEQFAGIAAQCCDHHVEGLRADLALGRAARAGAALAGRAHVTEDDLRTAADLVLPHRTRRPPPTPPTPDPPRGRDASQPAGEDSHAPAGTGDQIDPPGPAARLTLAARPTTTTTPDRGRSATLPATPRGRTVRAESGDAPAALDATLRATALRDTTDIGLEDLHRRVREDRRGSLVVFVAELLLALTRDAAAADRALARLPTGGRTPLAHGLVIATDLARDRATPVRVVVVSDGRANVSLPGTDADPWAQAVAACAAFVLPHVKVTVIDAEAGPEAGGRRNWPPSSGSSVCRWRHSGPSPPGGCRDRPHRTPALVTVSADGVPVAAGGMS